MGTRKELLNLLPLRTLCFGATLLSVVALAPAARGEVSIKRNILKDCATALEQARALSLDERKELLPYLTLVLRMQLSAMGDVLPAQPLPPSPSSPHPSVPRTPVEAAGEGFPGTNLWRTFEPERESEAKRCAVTILREFGPLSIEAVPDLIFLTEERSTSDELRVLVEETARQVAVEAARDPSFVVPASLVARLVSSLSGDTAPYALNILIELKRSALPLLIHEIKKPDHTRRDALFSALFQIDSDGSEIGSELIRFLDSPDETLRIRSLKMIGKIPPLYDRALPNVLLRLNDYSPSVQKVAGQTLQKMAPGLVSPFQEPLTNEGKGALIAALSSSSPSLREAIFRVLILATPSSEGVLSDLLRSSDDDIRARALAARLSLEKNPAPRFARLLDALYDPALPIRLNALRNLCQGTERSSEVVSSIIRLLKSDSLKSSPELKRELSLEAARCAAPLGAPPSLLPYLLETLAYEEHPHPGVEALTLYSSRATVPLIKALRSGDSTTRLNAASTFGALRPTPKQALDALPTLLRDPSPQVVAATQRALIAIGAPAIPFVLPSEREPQSRFASQVVLHRIAPFDAKRSELLSTAFREAPCSIRFDAAPLLASPNLTHRVDVAEALLSCKSEIERSAALHLLFQLTPLTPNDSKATLSALQGDALPQGVKLRLLERADTLPLPIEESTNMLLSLLHSDDNSLRSKVLGVLLLRPPLPEGVESELKKIAMDESEETMIRFDAAAVATRLTPQTFPTEEFFRDELEGEDYNWALLSLRKVPVTTALPILLAALRNADEDRQPFILETIAAFGKEGMSTVEALLPLTKSLHSPTRRGAVLALLSIRPTAPETIKLFREELNSLGALRLLPEELPSEVAPALEEFTQNPLSNVELSLSKTLLKRLRERPSDVTPEGKSEESLPTSSGPER